MENRDLKKLVVFYSFEGNTKFIAEGISDIVGADLLELKPKKDVASKGFMKYVWGGRQVITGKKPELLPMDKNLDDYDLIFIGTPIWASRYAPAINTFLDTTQINGKKIAFFCCHAGGGNGKAFKMLREDLNENEILGEMEFKDPLKKGREEAKEQLKEWIEGII
ncbi:flavodoxin [Wukongibacter baidiensis]|uniref:flavodoxin family protein n=1 Tax=Wukongibacter baidiensis TaxID=1723361 RepID=UPI003D7F6414